jgi:hypothetical protein
VLAAHGWNSGRGMPREPCAGVLMICVIVQAIQTFCVLKRGLYGIYAIIDPQQTSSNPSTKAFKRKLS